MRIVCATLFAVAFRGVFGQDVCTLRDVGERCKENECTKISYGHRKINELARLTAEGMHKPDSKWSVWLNERAPGILQAITHHKPMEHIEDISVITFGPCTTNTGNEGSTVSCHIKLRDCTVGAPEENGVVYVYNPELRVGHVALHDFTVDCPGEFDENKVKITDQLDCTLTARLDPENVQNICHGETRMMRRRLVLAVKLYNKHGTCTLTGEHGHPCEHLPGTLTFTDHIFFNCKSLEAAFKPEAVAAAPIEREGEKEVLKHPAHEEAEKEGKAREFHEETPFHGEETEEEKERRAREFHEEPPFHGEETEEEKERMARESVEELPFRGEETEVEKGGKARESLEELPFHGEETEGEKERRARESLEELPFHGEETEGEKERRARESLEELPFHGEEIEGEKERKTRESLEELPFHGEKTEEPRREMHAERAREEARVELPEEEKIKEGFEELPFHGAEAEQPKQEAQEAEVRTELEAAEQSRKEAETEKVEKSKVKVAEREVEQAIEDAEKLNTPPCDARGADKVAKELQAAKKELESLEDKIEEHAKDEEDAAQQHEKAAMALEK